MQLSASTVEHFSASRIMGEVKCGSWKWSVKTHQMSHSPAVSTAAKSGVIEASRLFLLDADVHQASHLPPNSFAYAHIHALMLLVKMRIIAQHFLNISVSQSLHVAQRKSKNTSTSLLLSCFSKPRPSNIYLPCVRFGKGQAEYSPLACQTKHPSVSVRFQWLLSVRKQTFPLKVTLRWAQFCLNQMGQFKCMFGNGDHIYYWISILFPAIVCCFMVYFDFSQLANVESCKTIRQ